MTDERDDLTGNGDDDDEEVGYRRPPKKYRWPKGQSGNPAGKKKGTKSLKTELLALMNETVEVPIKGKNKKVRMLALVLRGLAAKAAKGNVAAADKLLALVIQAVGFDDGEKERKSLSPADELMLQRLLGDGAMADEDGNSPEGSPAKQQGAPKDPRRETASA